MAVELDELSSTTGSYCNGSSAGLPHAATAADLDAADPVLRKYATTERVRHPLEENVFLSFAQTCAFHLVGLLVALPLALLLVAALIVAVPVRLFLYLLSSCLSKRRCIFRDTIEFFRCHCDLWWPLVASPADGLGRCVVTLSEGATLASIESEIEERVLANAERGRPYERYRRHRPASACCSSILGGWRDDDPFVLRRHVRESQRPPDAGETRSRHSTSTSKSSVAGVRLSTLQQLDAYLNWSAPSHTCTRSPWSVTFVRDFGRAGGEAAACSLVIVSVAPTLSEWLCAPRFLTVWAAGSLMFDAEPKWRRSGAGGGLLPTYSLFLTTSYLLWTWCQVVTAGPLSLILSACHNTDTIWADVVRLKSAGNGKQMPGVVQNRYRVPSSSSGVHRASSLLGSRPLLESAGGGRHRLSWARVPNMDQLLRAERILRASTLDLLLAFTAGALRRYFKANGVRFPPNLQISLPISARDYIPIGRQRCCDFVLLPLQIPCAVEGNIPRIWAVQRLLAAALDAAFPLASRVAAAAGDLLLPRSWLRAALGRTHRSSGCLVSFLRASGDLHLTGRRIHSILHYSPSPPSAKICFNFVQCGTEMIISLAVDAQVFPDPDAILAYFQAESDSLLRQLSVRLLTLSQATFLPASNLLHKQEALRARASAALAKDTPPSSSVLREEEESSDSSELCGGAPASASTFVDLTADAASHESASLEQLESLLATVQEELDAMRANPQGDRAEYVAKLSELEQKMEQFHVSISERLGPMAARVSADPDFAAESSAVEALLGPYRDESGGRKDSRSRRDSSVLALIRKRSRRHESPSRKSSLSARSFESQHP